MEPRRVGLGSAWSFKAHVLLRQRKDPVREFEAACVAYRKALAVNPADLPSMSGLAQTLSDYARHLALNGNNPWVLLEAAVGVLKQYLDRVPGDEQARALLGNLYMKLGTLAEGMKKPFKKYLEPAVKILKPLAEKGRVAPNYDLGFCLYYLKRYREALPVLEKAKKQQPQYAYILEPMVDECRRRR